MPQDPQFAMLLDSFLSLAQEQDQSIIEGAVMVFIPTGGSSSDASLFTWVSELSDQEIKDIWHDTFIAFLFALLKAGVGEETLAEIVAHAAAHIDQVTSEEADQMFSSTVH